MEQHSGKKGASEREYLWPAAATCNFRLFVSAENGTHRTAHFPE
jgi:hypothetical protein